MLAITIVLFVVPHNQQFVTIRQFFTYRISLFRNQNLNIQKKQNIFVFSQFIKFFYKLRTRRTIIFFKNYIEIILIIYFFLMLLLICTFVYLSYSILLFTILFDYCWDNQFLYYFIIC